MLPSITSILVNADSNTQLGSQPRHPKTGTFQGMAHSASRKGFSQEQSPEMADSSKGKGDDAPNTPAEEIEDEGDMIGQGDRPQVPRQTGGVREGKPMSGTHNSRRDANKERKRQDDEDDGEDDDDDDDDDETYNVDTTTGGEAAGSLHKAGEAGQVKYEGTKPSLGRAVGRVASSVVHPIQTVHGQGSLLVHHPAVAVTAAVKSIVHPIKHSVDAGIGKPEEHKATPLEAGQTRGHFGGEPMMEDTPHDQTLRAAGASLSHPASREHAVGAMDASMAGDSKGAAKLHKKSAREHLKEAELHMKDGNSEQAEAHMQAAAMHHKAAICHARGMVGNANPEGINQYSHAAKAAESAGSKASRMTLSRSGTKEERGEAHRAAADAHTKAAEMARASGMNEEASQHEEASRTHSMHASRARSPLTNREDTNVTLNRKNVIDFIVVNCDCAPTGGAEATRNMLKQKSNEELLGLKGKLLGLINTNAKAEGSFADTKGKGGKGMMAGGEGHGADDEVTYEEDEDDSTEDEPEQAKDAFTGKNNTTANQRSGPMTDEEWMAAAPPRIREVVRNAEANDNREKLALHRRITIIANGQHPQRKALILNELQGIKTKTGLQKLLGLVMPHEGITSNEEEAQQVYMGAGAPQANITDNQAQDDILVSPIINWAEEHEDARNGKSRQTSTASNGR